MNDPVSAVRELRSALGDTLQKFAGRLGLSISAITNYEGGRVPTGRALYELEHLARSAGRFDLAQVFAGAFATEMGWTSDPERSDAAWVQLIREIVRNKHLCPKWPELSAALVRELESLITVARSGMQIEGPLFDQESNSANLESLLVETRYEGKAKKIVEQLAREWLKNNPGKTTEQAQAVVWEQHPELNSQDSQERADAARGTRFESGFAVYGTRQWAEAQQKKAKKARTGKRTRK